MGGYKCSRASRCVCVNGEVISKTTAYRNYRKTLRFEKQLNPRTPKTVSPPMYVSSEISLHSSRTHEDEGSQKEEVTQEDNSITQRHTESIEVDEEQGMTSHYSSQRSPKMSYQIESEELQDPQEIDVASCNEVPVTTCEECTCFASPAMLKTAKQEQPLSSVHGGPSSAMTRWNAYSNDSSSACEDRESRSDEEEIVEGNSSKLYHFMRENSFVEDFAIKHDRATVEMMEDIMQDRQALYSWPGLRAALIRESMLSTELIPFCSDGHVSLISDCMKSLDRC
ncbi:unnamed protein product [Agarophyton chilense]